MLCKEFGWSEYDLLSNSCSFNEKSLAILAINAKSENDRHKKEQDKIEKKKTLDNLRSKYGKKRR